MRLLVVDDEPKIASLLKRGLRRASFAVDICEDGEAALDMLETESYSVIILDRMLPGKYDGIAVCRILRESGDTTPILMLTAKALSHHKVEGLNCGADDYLIKPFDFDELIARVRALARRPSTMESVVLRHNDIVLDGTKQTLMHGKTHVSVTARELALLEYFMRHPGQILSKEAIIAHVWPYDAIVVSNNVEVYIRMLRRKLDSPGKPSMITTVRGLGYKLK